MLIGIIEAVIGFGYIIGPVVGTILFSFGGYKCVFITLSVLFVPLAFGVYFFLDKKFDGIFEN